MATPTIETERLVLRAFEPADATDVFAYASNPNVSRFTTWETHRSVADSDAFIAMVLGRKENQKTWAIRLRSDPAVIGAIEFGPTDQPEARIDYVLAEPFWNRGLMTEAAKAVVAWGLEHCPAVKTVISCALMENVGSRRVMEKCGLRFDGVKMYRWAKRNEMVEQAQYRMNRGMHLPYGPNVRLASAADLGSIFVLARAFATSFAVDEEAFRRAFCELVSSPAACVLVAEVDGAVVGYLLGFEHLTFFANGRVAWVEELMVDDTQRRKGIGAALMNALNRWAEDRGCQMVALATRRAADFYAALGYEASATYFRKLKGPAANAD